MQVTTRQETVSAVTDDLLSRMTLREKVGQMTQLTLQAISVGQNEKGDQVALDSVKLRKALVEDHVGSFLNVFNQAMSREQWRALIGEIQQVARSETRLGIPILYGIDAVHGCGYTTDATLYPQNLNLGATWNRELVREIGRETARELTQNGTFWNFSPVLDLGRHPMWSRFSETFGEDPFIVSELGSEYIRGLQETEQYIAGCAKHFIGYGQAPTGRDRTPTFIPQRILRQLYLPPFQEAIDVGVASIMVNSGEINGVPVHSNFALLSTLLREELCFNGVIISDWEDVQKLHTVHRVASDSKQAIQMAIDAGLDMSMTPFTTEFSQLLVELVESGSVTEERIDSSVRRILDLKFKCGLLQEIKAHSADDEEAGVGGKPVGRYGNRSPEISRTEKQDELSFRAAVESIVLLQNKNDILPLNPRARLLLKGPAADSLAMIHGAWSYTWQGADEAAYPDRLQTVRMALNQNFDVVDAEVDCDAVVVCIGEHPSVEKPGDIDELNLAADQQTIIAEAIETGKPVILVFFAGRPRMLSGIQEFVSAVFWAGQPGPFSGQALSAILSGQISPSGRLPFTFPHSGSVFFTHDHKWADKVGADYGVAQEYSMNGVRPAWEFGHGLSYSRFQYSRPDVAVSSESVSVSFSVTNTGQRAARENVLVFVRDHFASITPEVKRLAGFETRWLDAGESTKIDLKLPYEALSFISMANERIVEPGAFSVLVGVQEVEFVLTNICLASRREIT